MFDYLKDYIYSPGRFALIIDRSKLEYLWVWCLHNYNFSNTLTDFKDFSNFLKDDEKTFLLLEFRDIDLIFLRDYNAKDKYNDWENWQIIDLKAIVREQLLREMLDVGL